MISNYFSVFIHSYSRSDCMVSQYSRKVSLLICQKEDEEEEDEIHHTAFTNHYLKPSYFIDEVFVVGVNSAHFLVSSLMPFQRSKQQFPRWVIFHSFSKNFITKQTGFTTLD